MAKVSTSTGPNHLRAFHSGGGRAGRPEKGFASRWRSARARTSPKQHRDSLRPPDSYISTSAPRSPLSVKPAFHQNHSRSVSPLLSLLYHRAVQSAFRHSRIGVCWCKGFTPAEPDVMGFFCMVQLALCSSELRDALSELPMSEPRRILLIGCMETRFPELFWQHRRAPDLLRDVRFDLADSPCDTQTHLFQQVGSSIPMCAGCHLHGAFDRRNRPRIRALPTKTVVFARPHVLGGPLRSSNAYKT